MPNTAIISADTIEAPTANDAVCAVSATSTTAGSGTAAPVTDTIAAIPRYPVPRRNGNVIITHAADHRHVFIRSADRAATDDYLQTLLAINEIGCDDTDENPAPPLTELPARGACVLTHTADGLHNRALVLTASDQDRIEVAYIDFGNRDVRSLDDLRRMPAHLLKLAKHPIEVLLSDVPKLLQTDAPGALLGDLIDKGTVLRMHFEVNDKSGGIVSKCDRLPAAQWPVRLIDVKTNVCINDTLAHMNVVEAVGLTEPPICLQHLKLVPIPTGEPVELLVLDNSMLHLHSNTLVCVRRSDQEKLVHTNRRFQEFCKQTTGPYTPR